MMSFTECVRGRSETIVSRPSDSNLCGNFSTLDLEDLKPLSNTDEIKRSRTVSESSSRSESVGKVRKIKRSRRGGGTSNVLHFLKRLLDDSKYESIINWRDREKGVFVIDDRKGILDIWNENKSRPVKNWNNFALVFSYNFLSNFWNWHQYSLQKNTKDSLQAQITRTNRTTSTEESIYLEIFSTIFTKLPLTEILIYAYNYTNTNTGMLILQKQSF